MVRRERKAPLAIHEVTYVSAPDRAPPVREIGKALLDRLDELVQCARQIRWVT